MTNGPDRHRRQEVFHVAEQAAAWLHVLHSQELQPGERTRFFNWLKESPLHVKEFLRAYQWDRRLSRAGNLRHIDIDALVTQIPISNVTPIGNHAILQPARAARRKPLRWAVGIAAAVLLLVAVPTLIRHFTDTYETGIGEQRSVMLPDGSAMFLNAQSHAQIRFSSHSRDIYLQTGQALFDVKHDTSRPFRVHAAGAVVEALGTQFDVHLFADRLAVAVVEGAVQVTGSTEPTTPGDNVSLAVERLSAGEATTVTGKGRIAPATPVDIQSATGWWQQQLTFDDAPLTQIAAEFNRYNRLQLVIGDAGAGAKRYNGLFGARKPESLLNYLAKKDDTLVFERHDNVVVIRSRTSATDVPSPQ